MKGGILKRHSRSSICETSHGQQNGCILFLFMFTQHHNFHLESGLDKQHYSVTLSCEETGEEHCWLIHCQFVLPGAQGRTALQTNEQTHEKWALIEAHLLITSNFSIKNGIMEIYYKWLRSKIISLLNPLLSFVLVWGVSCNSGRQTASIPPHPHLLLPSISSWSTLKWTPLPNLWLL